MSPILALSVTDKIEQYGAYAGFASVLGLAVLSLLYFAQAREVKRLREWAGRAPERAAELQAGTSAGVQPRPQPAPGQPAVAQTAAGAAARPAGAPAPATAAAQATQQTPPGQPGQPQPAGAPGAPAPATAAAAATAAGAAAAATPAAHGPQAPGQQTSIQPAAGGNGSGPAGQQPRPGQPLRAPAGSASARSMGAPPASEGRSRGTILAIAGAIAAILVVGLVLVFGVFGGGDDGGSTQKAQPAPAATTGGGDGSATPDGTTTAPIKPGSFTTAVLNGTTVPGLARGVANRLSEADFRMGQVTNALNQTRSQTLVEYKAGHKREGLLVAKAIDVGSDAVQPISAGSQTLAGQEATVVVTVGADQNTSPQG